MKTLLEKLTETLGLDEGADENKVFDAVKGALSERDQAKQDLADKASDEKSLEDRAKDEGKVVMDAEQVKDLTDRLTDTEKELTGARFDKHFDKALDDKRVDAKPETRERFQKLFAQDEETTISILENSPKLVNDEARGKGGSDAIDDVPDGVDPEAHKLDLKVKAYRKEHTDLSYAEAYEKVLADQEETD
jgi:hypothetical protein